jgi:uncharacterized protein (DUF2236 family)
MSAASDRVITDEPGVDADRASVALPPPEEVVAASEAVAPLALAAANVIMQLALLPVGRGVAESRVDSGRADLHPIKRLRTTLTYVVITVYGTDAERAALRREVNRAHKDVHSLPGDPVEYNAFDPELQLWVAACLTKGTEDGYLWLRGPMRPEAVEPFYRYCSRFATGLQVRQDMWPPDKAAFDEYWRAGVERIEMDDVTRRYLQDLARLAFLPAPVRWTLGPVHELVTLGFLPEVFRAELGLPWTERRQRAFNAVKLALKTGNRILPGPVRRFPMNAYLWDARRRLRTGRPVV